MGMMLLLLMMMTKKMMKTIMVDLTQIFTAEMSSGKSKRNTKNKNKKLIIELNV